MRVMLKLIAALMFVVPGLAVAQTVQAHYEAYSTGFNILRMDADFAITPNEYRVHLAYRTAGTLSAVVRSEQNTVVEGAFRDGNPAPRRFYSHGYLRGRPRTTQIDYPGGQPVIRTLIPINDEEREPIAAADQTGTIDSLSAMARLVRQVNATGRCDGRSRTFDGRRLADMTARTVGPETLEATGRSSFAGPALRCDFEGVQTGGFMLDGDRAAARRPHKGSAWFAAVTPGGPLIPVRLAFQTRFIGSVTVYLAKPE